jgi:hypothetical protein
VRLLIAMPHYFRAEPGGSHGSLRAGRAARAASLRASVAALHQLFGARQYVIDIAQRRALKIAERSQDLVDVIVCIARGDHVLADLELPDGAYREHRTDAEPSRLGFECHAVLRDYLGEYDYYGYMEDDLVIRDPWFFAKLGWFTETVGNAAVLQPNRYEVDAHRGGRKAYVDGDLRPDVTARFQDVRAQPAIDGQVMGVPVHFRRPLNPHSGCFFLNHVQMAHWAAQPHFLDADTSFVGPLESAATLGVMRTFRIYKPAPDSSGFLEVEHAGGGFISLIGE